MRKEYCDDIIKEGCFSYLHQKEEDLKGLAPVNARDLSNGARRQSPQQAGAPEINASEQDLNILTAETWAAIHKANNPPVLFRRAGRIVRVEPDDDGRPVIQTVTLDRMRYRLAEVAEWYRPTQKGDRLPAKPPGDLIKNILATPNPELPVLAGIVEVPVFGKDGSLLEEPGYHAGSRTLYAPPPGFQLPALPRNPSRQDLQRARSLVLDDLLVDFPFVGDADRAHAVALLLLPLVRNLITGPTPLHLIEKPKPGTGATLLVEVIVLVATGRGVSIMPLAPSEGEMNYTITAALRGGDAVILLDNITRRLDSSALAAAITSTDYTGRQVGTSALLKLPVRNAWVATANNPTLSNEMARRTVVIRLDTELEHPEQRADFKHPRLKDWVRDHQGDLVAAGLNLVRVWVAEGRPSGGINLGMFESWAEVMGGILHVAEIPGFLENQGAFRESADPDELAFQDFAGRWWKKHKDKRVKVSNVFANEALLSLMDLGSGEPRQMKIRLGKKIAAMRDRVFEIDEDGHPIQVRLESAGVEHNTQVWRLVAKEGN